MRILLYFKRLTILRHNFALLLIFVYVAFQELISALLGCSLLCLFPDTDRSANHLPTINFDQLFAYVTLAFLGISFFIFIFLTICSTYLVAHIRSHGDFSYSTRHVPCAISKDVSSPIFLYLFGTITRYILNFSCYLLT